MSNSEPRPKTFAQIAASKLWIIVLAAAIAILLLATSRRIDQVNSLTNSPTWSADAPAIDPQSPTGLAKGQRSLIVTGHHNPSFSWITEAQLTAHAGDLRLRHINYDASPEGRSTLRSAPYRWWLVTVGSLRSLVTSEPLGLAIERGALIADPLLLALLLIAGTLYTARALGPIAATGFAIGVISIFPLSANFQPGAPDSHSLAWVLALASILPLLAATQHVAANKKRHLILAGLFCSLAFWTDSTSQTPVLLAILLGGIGYELLSHRNKPQPQPSLHWRTWAIAAALPTLAASLFEFGPSSFSWTLESINPIHALAILAVGEILHASSALSQHGFKSLSTPKRVLFALALLAVAAWCVADLRAEAGFLLAPDFYANQLANHPQGGIASNFSRWLASADAGAKFATLLPCLLFLILAIQLFTAKADANTKATLLFLLLPILILLPLASLQIRWWNLLDAFALLALTALFAQSQASDLKQKLSLAGLALCLLPGLLVGFPSPAKADAAPSDIDAQTLVERDFSYWLASRGGEEPIVLFTSPIFSGAAAYYGGFDVIVSTDEENKSGYESAIRIASASTAQEIDILLRSHKITHITLPLWDPVMDQLVRIGRKIPRNQPLPQNAFTVALRDWDVPPTLRVLNYRATPPLESRGFQLSTFTPGPEQDPELGLSRLADIFLERAQLREAASIRETLRSYPRSPIAIGAIANIDFALRQKDALETSLETLIPYLSRRSARNLPADRRVSLAGLFIQTKRGDLAREQVEACLADLDRDTLRAMTPQSVALLVALARSLKIDFPDQALETYALTLIQPDLRAQLPKK